MDAPEMNYRVCIYAVGAEATGVTVFDRCVVGAADLRQLEDLHVLSTAIEERG